VFFVDLSPITDPRLVPDTIASALLLRAESVGRPVLEILTDHLRNRSLLLTTTFPGAASHRLHRRRRAGAMSFARTTAPSTYMRSDTPGIWYIPPPGPILVGSCRESMRTVGVDVIETPVRARRGNAFAERWTR
jgi:hypothetical protein